MALTPTIFSHVRTHILQRMHLTLSLSDVNSNKQSLLDNALLEFNKKIENPMGYQPKNAFLGKSTTQAKADTLSKPTISSKPVAVTKTYSVAVSGRVPNANEIKKLASISGLKIEKDQISEAELSGNKLILSDSAGNPVTMVFDPKNKTLATNITTTTASSNAAGGIDAEAYTITNLAIAGGTASGPGRPLRLRRGPGRRRWCPSRAP